MNTGSPEGPERYGALARLYIPEKLNKGGVYGLAPEQAHYLRNVLRKNTNDTLRVFHPESGEFLARLVALDKKGAQIRLEETLRPPERVHRRVGLLFAPIKKARLEMLIEKAVELGVTDLIPVITRRTENRTFKPERLQAQVIEAAEQCERMTIPALHPARGLDDTLRSWDKNSPVFWARERATALPLAETVLQGDVFFLIGPEGGFDDAENALLEQFSFIQPITLGPAVLRAETASFVCLSAALMKAPTQP